MEDPQVNRPASPRPSEGEGPPAKRVKLDEADVVPEASGSSADATAKSFRSAWTQTPGARTRPPKSAKGKAPARDDTDRRGRLTRIPKEQSLLLELPSGNIKQETLTLGKTVNLGKYGSFHARDLVGKPFGLSYEIGPAENENGSGPGPLKAVLDTSLAELEETDATNEFIKDDGASQALTYVDIKALKESGKTGQELIDMVTASSTSFTQRTVYSQDKFIKRKEQKHMKMFTPLAPSAHNICKWLFVKNPVRIRKLRPDALGQLLTLADIHAGGRYLVVEETGGLILGAMLERMLPNGRIIMVNDADSPPAVDTLSTMNLDAEEVNEVFRFLHWAQTEKDWKPADLPTTEEAGESDVTVNLRDKNKRKKRKAGYDLLEATRKELHGGNFDALVISSDYDTFSIIEKLLPYLAGSARIVVHGPVLQPLMETFARLRVMHELVNVQLTEPWMRKYQVLPGRMHPEMTTSASGGYLLSATRVLPYVDQA